MSEPRPELRVLVVGAAGYVGGELLRLLLQHPQVGRQGVTAISRSRTGQPIAAAHPTLAPLTSGHFVHGELSELAATHDVVMLAVEHGESGRLMGELFAADPRLILDLAADFRVADLELYQRYYGPHPAPALLPQFVYGLADVLGTELRGARAIAVPGCFATAAQLALYPLRELLTDVTPALFGITGSSGGGAKLRDSSHHPARAHNLFAYSVLGHRHEAEILHSWRRWTGRSDGNARLICHSGPFVRGIYLTLHATLTEPIPDGIAEHAFVHAYRDRPLIRLLDHPPELSHSTGGSYALIHAAQSSDGREVQVMVAIDNLLKGAAGQAIQAMNLALGLPESAGLVSVGAFPC